MMAPEEPSLRQPEMCLNPWASAQDHHALVERIQILIDNGWTVKRE